MTRDVRVLDEGVHHRGQAVDQLIPFGLFIGGARRAQIQHGLQILAITGSSEDVHLDILATRKLALELALEYQGSARTHVRIKEHPRGQMRGEVGEIGETLIRLGQHSGRQSIQTHRGQCRHLASGGVHEHDTGFLEDEVRGDGLLVKDLGTRLTPDRRQAVHRSGEGLAGLDHRRNGRPDRSVGDGQRGGGLVGRGTDIGAGDRSRNTQVRHDRAHRNGRLIGPGESIQGLVVEPHGEAVGVGGPSGQEGRTPHELHRAAIHGLTRQRQRSLRHFGAVVPDLKVEGQPIGLVHAHIDQIEGVIAGGALGRRGLAGQQESLGVDVGPQPSGQRHGTRFEDERLGPA